MQPMPRVAAWLLLLGLPSLGMGASVEDVLQTVDQNLTPEELQEPGSQARAKAIDALLHTDLGLTPSQQIDLTLALAEAWIDAGQSAPCETLVQALAKAGGMTPAQQERAGLAFIAAWQLDLAASATPDTLTPATTAVAALGDLGPKVAARAQVAEASRLLLAVDDKGIPTKGVAALAHYDRALALLAAAPPAERVPVYHLRLLAMEAMKQKPEVVAQFLLAHQSDPAAMEVAESALTDGQKMLGSPAPPLSLPRVDGTAGKLSLADFKGHPVIVFFCATWQDASRALAPVVQAVAARHADVRVLGVCLDTKDTLKNVPGWVQATGVAFPIVSDGLGWDGETAAAYQVDKIPALVVVGADGRVLASDLIGAAPAQTGEALEAALAPPARPRPAPRSDGGEIVP